MEGNHLGYEYPSTSCDLKFKNKPNLMNHMKRMHKEKDIYCFLCDYKTSSSNQLKRHHTIKHEGFRVLQCHFCTYGAQNQADLAKHITNIHYGQRFTCDQCHYKARDKSKVNHHVKAEHENIVHQCDQSEYEARTGRVVARHTKVYLPVLCVTSSQFIQAQSQSMFAISTLSRGNIFLNISMPHLYLYSVGLFWGEGVANIYVRELYLVIEFQGLSNSGTSPWIFKGVKHTMYLYRSI